CRLGTGELDGKRRDVLVTGAPLGGGYGLRLLAGCYRDASRGLGQLVRPHSLRAAVCRRGALTAVPPALNLLHRPEEQHGPADRHLVPRTQPSNLYRSPVDPSAIGAIEIGQDDVAFLGLDLGVITAHSLIVEPERITFLPTDRHRDGQVAKDP